MCGLHGFIAKERHTTADDFIKDCFVAGQLRGGDASGIASIHPKEGAMALQKLPVPGTFFITDKYAMQLVRAANIPGTISMCHTRAATTGGQGHSEAHPFHVVEGERELVGTHNGTLSDWRGKPLASKYAVDSEWALNHIFLHGAEGFKDINGAFTFVWWDSDSSETLNIALNDQRPLHVAFLKKGGMAYASEPGMLHWLLERNRVEVVGPIVALAAHYWYKFDINNPKEFTKEKLLRQPAAPVNYGTSYSHGSSHRRSSSTDIISKVDALLLKIGGARPALTATVGTKSGLTVKLSEISRARQMSLYKEEGKFVPYWYDESTNEMYGMFDMGNGMDFNAIIRNSGDIEFKMDAEWDVACIGIDDDGKTINAICTKPFHITSKPTLMSDKTAPVDGNTVN